jgi:hypothetical protein
MLYYYLADLFFACVIVKRLNLFEESSKGGWIILIGDRVREKIIWFCLILCMDWAYHSKIRYKNSLQLVSRSVRLFDDL